MTSAPRVTVLCATRNARPAVRLTLASFARYSGEPCRVIVADNGSTDGTLRDLRATPWLEVTSLAERRAEVLRTSAALAQRLDSLATALPASERSLVAGLASAARDEGMVDGEALVDHGATLDWLAARVRTPYFLTLDSDVEFLGPGWLPEMVRLMDSKDLIALGPYEPGFLGYKPRLAPHALLLRTGAFRELGVSFRARACFSDVAEARNWAARGSPVCPSAGELAYYRNGSFYPTAAHLFETIERAGGPWQALPHRIAQKMRHFRHMSWAHRGARGNGSPTLRAEHRSRRAVVVERLSLYSDAPAGPPA